MSVLMTPVPYLDSNHIFVADHPELMSGLGISALTTLESIMSYKTNVSIHSDIHNSPPSRSKLTSQRLRPPIQIPRLRRLHLRRLRLRFRLQLQPPHMLSRIPHTIPRLLQREIRISLGAFSGLDAFSCGHDAGVFVSCTAAGKEASHTTAGFGEAGGTVTGWVVFEVGGAEGGGGAATVKEAAACARG